MNKTNKTNNKNKKEGRGIVRIVKIEDRTVTYNICMCKRVSDTMCRMCE